MLSLNRQVLFACFENYEVGEALIKFLGVVVNLPKSFDEIATVLAALRIEKLRIGH